MGVTGAARALRHGDVDSQALYDALPFVIGVLWPLLWLAESARPLRRPAPGERVRHVVRNVGVMIGGFAVNAVYGPTLALIAGWTQERGVGLLALAPLPLWLDLLAGVLLLDLIDYWRHRAHHHLAPLWRLHQVHHLDEAPDSSTGLLNHPLEVIPSLAIFTAGVLAFGISPLALAVRMLVGMGALLFHHSNLALPPRLDAALSLVTPTPRTHRVHHARRAPLTDSNFGTVFTFWDRLFGTWRVVPDPGALDTGLDDWPRQSAGALLLHPFKRPPRSPARASAPAASEASP